MKFSSPITLSWKGVCLKTNKYSLFLPWSNPFKYRVSTRSVTNTDHAPSKLHSLEYSDLVTDWVSLRYPKSHVIILTNVNVEAKNIKFWAKVPTSSMMHFVQDVVILHCTDKSEVVRLVENISAEFADAQGFSAGSLIITNKEP